MEKFQVNEFTRLAPLSEPYRIELGFLMLNFSVNKLTPKLLEGCY